MFLSIVNVSRSGYICTVKYHILQVVFLRLILRLLIYRTVIFIANRPCSIYFYYIVEAVVLIILPKRNAVGKWFIRILGVFNYYAPDVEGVCIVYNINCNVK